MVSPFAAAALAADAILDKAYAEAVLVEPQNPGEYQQTVDPERPPFTVRGIVTVLNDTVRPDGPLRSDSTFPPLAGETVRIAVRDVELAGHVARQSDRVILLERPGDHALTIHSIEPDGVGRATWRCIRSPK